MQPDGQKVWVDAIRELLELRTPVLLAIVVWGVALLVFPALRPFPQWLILLAASALVGRVAVWAWQKGERAARRNQGYKRAVGSMSFDERRTLAAAWAGGARAFQAAQLDTGAQLLAAKGFATMVGPTPDWSTFTWEIDAGLWEWLRRHPKSIGRTVEGDE